MSRIRLTIEARDVDHARAILDAVKRLEPVGDDGDDEILVSPDGAHPCPAGHTYRELADARRAGLLEATVVPLGLVFRRSALEAYRRTRGERRRRRRAERPSAEVSDLTARRIAQLERARARNP